MASDWFHGRSSQALDSIFLRHYGANSTRRAPSGLGLVKTLIATNLLVFGAWTYGEYRRDAPMLRTLTERFTLSLYNLKQHRYYTLLTSAFSHKDLAHIAFNMLNFWTFGQIFAAAGIGMPNIAAVCLASAIGGSAAWAYHHAYVKSDPRPAQRSIYGSQIVHRKDLDQAIGASGMVMGAGAVAACLWPLAPMNFMFVPVSVPLFAIVGAYFAVDAYFLDGGGRIGHAAHLGGGAVGVAYYFLALRGFGGVWQMLMRRR